MITIFGARFGYVSLAVFATAAAFGGYWAYQQGYQMGSTESST
jgi:hypothetical protein